MEGAGRGRGRGKAALLAGALLCLWATVALAAGQPGASGPTADPLTNAMLGSLGGRGPQLDSPPVVDSFAGGVPNVKDSLSIEGYCKPGQQTLRSRLVSGKVMLRRAGNYKTKYGHPTNRVWVADLKLPYKSAYWSSQPSVIQSFQIDVPTFEIVIQNMTAFSVVDQNGLIFGNDDIHDGPKYGVVKSYKDKGVTFGPSIKQVGLEKVGSFFKSMAVAGRMVDTTNLFFNEVETSIPMAAFALTGCYTEPTKEKPTPLENVDNIRLEGFDRSLPDCTNVKDKIGEALCNQLRDDFITNGIIEEDPDATLSPHFHYPNCNARAVMKYAPPGTPTDNIDPNAHLPFTFRMLQRTSDGSEVTVEVPADAFLLASHVFAGVDLLMLAEQGKPLPFEMRAGIADEFYLEDLTVDVSLTLPKATGKMTATIDKLSEVPVPKTEPLDVDLQPTQLISAKGGAIDPTKYYEFIACGLRNEPLGGDAAARRVQTPFDDPSAPALGVFQFAEDAGKVYSVYYMTVREIDDGPDCDCATCCRPGAYFGTINAKVGCVKKTQASRIYASFAVDAEDARIEAAADLIAKNEASQKTCKGTECPQLDADLKFMQDVLKRAQQDRADAYAKLLRVDQCLNCNILSRQAHNLFNPDKWKQNLWHDALAPASRREYFSYEGFKRDDGAFDVCDICAVDPNAEDTCVNSGLSASDAATVTMPNVWHKKVDTSKTIKESAAANAPQVPVRHPIHNYLVPSEYVPEVRGKIEPLPEDQQTFVNAKGKKVPRPQRDNKYRWALENRRIRNVMQNGGTLGDTPAQDKLGTRPASSPFSYINSLTPSGSLSEYNRAMGSVAAQLDKISAGQGGGSGKEPTGGGVPGTTSGGAGFP